MTKFFIGLDNVSHAWPFKQTVISVNRIRGRKSGFRINDWIMDSGAFTEISNHGRWRTPPEDYAREIVKHSTNGTMLAAVSQDYMCEDFILEKTGLSIPQHQSLTIERYRALVSLTGIPIMPVLQGYSPGDYVIHLEQYGDLLLPGHWVGVGSVCKRNSDPDQIEFVLRCIKSQRPDLRLHGFGLKTTALKNPSIRELLHSSDSMAWSYHCRMNGLDNHDPRNALAYAANIQKITGEKQFVQEPLFEWWQDDFSQDPTE